MLDYPNHNTSAIKISSGTISISTPDTTSVWDAESSYYVYWTWTGDIEHVIISLYEGGSYYSEISSYTSNNGEYSWTISSNTISSDSYQIKIEDYNDTSTYAYSDYFTIIGVTTTSKSITITNPTSDSKCNVEDEYTIEWTSSGYIGYVDILLYESNSKELTIDEDVYDDGSYSWKIPSDLGSSKNYQIKIVDSDDSSIYDYSDEFEIVGKSETTNSSVNFAALSLVIAILVIVGVVVVICVVIGSSQKKPELKPVIGPTPLPPIQPPMTPLTQPSAGPPKSSIEPEMEKIKICPYCGSALEKDALFCTFCGIELKNGGS